MRAIANHGQRPKREHYGLAPGSIEAERGPACRAASKRESLLEADTCCITSFDQQRGWASKRESLLEADT